MPATRCGWQSGLALLCAALASQPAASSDDDGSSNVLEVRLSGEPLHVDPLLQQLPEGQEPWDLDRVRGAPLAGRFVGSSASTINHGFNTTAYWYRVRLKNGSDPRRNSDLWVLEFSYPLLNFIDIHIVRPGHPTEVILSGNQRPPPSSQIPNRTLAFPMKLAPGETLELYFRVKTESTHVINLNVWSTSAFAAKAHTENIWFGMFFGLMAGLALYNFFVWLTVRDIAYVYHVLYIVTIMAIQFDLHGFSRLYLWGGPGWTNLTIPLFIALPAAFSVLFSRAFLQTGRNAPLLHRILSVVLVLLGGCTALAVLAPYSVSMPILAQVAALVSLLLVITGVSLFLKGVREARFYLLAWSMYLVAVVLRVLEATGMLPPSFFTEYGVLVGSSVIVTLLSLALADRIVAANIELESRVEQKRIELEESYRRMQILLNTRVVAQERERIMRDLHDGIGGQLVTALNLSRVSSVPAIEQTLRDAMDDMRLVIDSLDPVEGDLLVVLATVRSRFETRLSQQGLRFSWQVTDIPAIPDFGPDKALQVLRIMQEAITNILKHAKASTITIRTGRQPVLPEKASAVFVEIADDGLGISGGPTIGHGLRNMRNRAARIGGRLDLDSGNPGTAVRLWLPLSA